MTMTNRVRIEILCNAVRWANNMVVEAASNHSRALTTEQRQILVDATTALGRALDMLRSAAARRD